MKSWDVVVTFYRESFNGYDLCDGNKTYTVDAKTYISSVNKVKKIVNKELKGNWSQSRWYRI